MSRKATTGQWRADSAGPAIQIFVSEMIGDLPKLIEGTVAGFPVAVNLVTGSDWIDVNDFASAAAGVVQVDADHPASMKRFQLLAANSPTPLIAASFEPPLSLVRTLMRAGARDVIPLPLTADELEASLAPLLDDAARLAQSGALGLGKLVTAVKSVGGVGATAILTQLALDLATESKAREREVCLIDLDVQFGDVAFQLGSRHKLTLTDLLDAGSRLDSDLLRSTTIKHRSGLNFIAAPRDMLPLEGMPSDQILQIVELSQRNFSTVLVDLPTNWTNWSLSLVARSDAVLLFTELSVAGLNGARRQLDLLQSQGLGDLDVRVVVNRFVKSQLRNFREQDIRKALGREVSFYIANDFQLMRSAIDRGLPLDELKRKSELGSDINALAEGLAGVLDLER